MSDKSITVEIPEETQERLRKLQNPNETLDETVQRVINEATEDDLGLYSLFTLVAIVGAVLWLGSFVMFGESVSNSVGGIFIASTLLWVIWKEIQFYSV